MEQYKIITFSLFDSYKHGDILEKFFQLRYQGFVIEEKLDLPTYGDAEFDQYDNPFARYIAILNKEGEIVACSRINRTDIPYMAKDCWNHLIQARYFPQSPTIYEWTRQYVSSKLETVERIKMERIICAATYLMLLNLKATGACLTSNHSSFLVMERLGMNPKSVARLNLPNFPNLHFVHVDVNHDDAQNVARNLLEMTGFDIAEFFKI